jgi:hypothetical protein
MPRGIKANPNPNETAPVSVKSTKQELLTAYQKLADQLAGSDKLSGEQADFFHPQTPTDASKTSSQLQVEMEELQKKLNHSLQDLSAKILPAAKELEIIKEEINQGRKQLADDYKIKAEASTLQNLLQLKLEE